MNPQQALPGVEPDLGYPEDDGQPMSENTVQFRWIGTIQGGLDTIFLSDPRVFVAGDLLWYPVEGEPTIRAAPDVMVVFGRPKGDRSSYRQWEEDHIPPQVVFEVLSPGNRAGELAFKLDFYERYGAEECYVYDPDRRALWGRCRVGDGYRQITNMRGWVSPRLQIRFDWRDDDLCLVGPDGRPFSTYVELYQQRQAAEQRANLADERANLADERAERFAAQLRALGIDPAAIP